MNFFLRAMQNIIFIIIGVVIIPVFYKYLGPDKIGEISYVDSWATIFSIFASFGFARYGTRELSKSDFEVRFSIYSNIRRFVITNHIVVSSLYLMVAYFFLKDKVDTIFLIISLISVNRNFLNHDWIYESLERFNLVSFKNIIIKIFLILCLLVLFICEIENFQYYFYFLTSGFPFISFLILYLYFLCEKKSIIGSAQKVKYFGFNYYRYLFPSLLLSNSYLLFFQADKLILGGYNLYEVGLYSFTERIILLIFPIIMSLVIVGIPKITKSFIDDQVTYRNLVEEMLLKIYFLVIPLSTVIFIFSNEIVFLLGGEEFESSSTTLRIFAITLSAMALWRFITSCVYYASSNEWSCFIIITFLGFVGLVIKSYFIVHNANAFISLTLIIHIIVIAVLYFHSRIYLKINFCLYIHRALYYLALSLISVSLAQFTIKHFNFPSLVEFIASLMSFSAIYILILILTKDKVMRSFFYRGKGCE